MSKPLTLNGNFSDLVGKLYLPIGLTIVFLGSLSGLIFLGTIKEYAYITFAIFAVIPLLYLMVRYPRIWIYLIALTNIYFFYEREKEVSFMEIILAIQYLGSVGFWMLWMVFVKREKIIHNIADLFILFFLIIVLANSVIGYLNSNDMYYWIRESFNLLLLSIYFPVRKYFSEKKHLITLLIIYSIVVTTSACLHFYTYTRILQGDIHYAYELMKGIRVNQTLFTAAAVFGFIFALYNQKKFISILLTLFTSIAIIGLVTSFSRTFWVILLAELIIVIFYLSGKQKIKLLIYTTLTTILILVTMFYVFEDKSKVMLQLIENRFVSTGRGTKDISVQARFVEYKQVLKGIEEYPMAGNGLSDVIVYWNSLESYTTRVRFIHNGYLYIMYKLGIPALFVCFFPFVYFLIKGERFARKETDEFYRILCVGSFMAIILMFVSNFTAAQISSREAMFVTALSFAFIGIVMEKKKLNEV
ncbi:MAG: O-antigen ligase family protein [bacterium]